MKRLGTVPVMTTAAAALMSLAAVGCSSAPPGFAGSRWQVTAITHGGQRTSVPARDDVFLDFASGGQFLANEPINSHSGTYRPAGDGFTTDDLAVTAVGYAGRNPVTLLAISAISSFDNGVHASATVTGDLMTVSVGGYRLTCHRDGQQPGS